MEGVRVLEVAQWTFTPAAGGVLADWGADVIKVEHAVTGDAQRGMLRMGLSDVGEVVVRPDHGAPEPREAQHRDLDRGSGRP